MPAQLKCPDIGDDGPAVLGWNPRGIRVHRTIAIGDDIEEMLVIRGTQTVVMIAGWARHAALDDDAAAVTPGAMTRRAENSKSFAAAREQRRRQRRPVLDCQIMRRIISRNDTRRRIAQHAATKRRR